MKAIQVTCFATDGNLAFVEDAPVPRLEPKTSDLLVRVQACALNPGDCRVMSGSVSLFLKPKAFPYIPGLDVCGIVEAVGERCESFSVGDRVAVALEPLAKHGGLAEYVLCDPKRATLAPSDLTSLQVASLPIAGSTALQAVKDAHVEVGSKILVLGASGGVGSLVVQLAKACGASFVAATSTDEPLVSSLGADAVIDYRASKWWDVLAGRDLDAVIDCVGCDESWAHCDRALARRGRYVAVVDGPDTQVRSLGDLLRFAGRMLPRMLNPFSTSYTMVQSFPLGDDVKAVMDLARENKIRAVLDPLSPVAFSLAGVERAIARQNSHRAKGKLVFQISPKSSL